jgi:hypothetical protein
MPTGRASALPLSGQLYIFFPLSLIFHGLSQALVAMGIRLTAGNVQNVQVVTPASVPIALSLSFPCVFTRRRVALVDENPYPSCLCEGCLDESLRGLRADDSWRTRCGLRTTTRAPTMVRISEFCPVRRIC